MDLTELSHLKQAACSLDYPGAGTRGNKRDDMFTVNFRGCKYYEDVICMTAEGMRNQISVLTAEVHFNVSCEVS